MKYLLGYICYVLFALSIVSCQLKSAALWRSSDQYIRLRVFKLHSDKGSCTGVQVRGPSGKLYILTASHCEEIMDGQSVTAQDEAGKEELVSFWAVDKNSDLMLLSPMGDKSIEIAGGTEPHQHVHTIAHGEGYPSYRTDGEILSIQTVTVPFKFIDSLEDLQACPTTPKQAVVPGPFPGVMLCAHIWLETMTTAWALPGASGGPVLDEAGRLVGIISVSDGMHIMGMQSLDQIKAFLKDF